MLNTLLKSPFCVALIATLILFLSSLAIAARKFPNHFSDAVVVSLIVAGVGFFALRRLVIDLNAQLISAGRTLDEFVLNLGLDCVMLFLVGGSAILLGQLTTAILIRSGRWQEAALRLDPTRLEQLQTPESQQLLQLMSAGTPIVFTGVFEYHQEWDVYSLDGLWQFDREPVLTVSIGNKTLQPELVHSQPSPSLAVASNAAPRSTTLSMRTRLELPPESLHTALHAQLSCTIRYPNLTGKSDTTGRFSNTKVVTEYYEILVKRLSESSTWVLVTAEDLALYRNNQELLRFQADQRAYHGWRETSVVQMALYVLGAGLLLSLSYALAVLRLRWRTCSRYRPAIWFTILCGPVGLTYISWSAGVGAVLATLIAFAVMTGAHDQSGAFPIIMAWLASPVAAAGLVWLSKLNNRRVNSDEASIRKHPNRL